jgi:hypothetical protein
MQQWLQRLPQRKAIIKFPEGGSKIALVPSEKSAQILGFQVIFPGGRKQFANEAAEEFRRGRAFEERGQSPGGVQRYDQACRLANSPSKALPFKPAQPFRTINQQENAWARHARERLGHPTGGGAEQSSFEAGSV